MFGALQSPSGKCSTSTIWGGDSSKDWAKRWKRRQNGSRQNARGYCELLQEHIFREDNILYPMADEALKEEIQKDILGKFCQNAGVDV